MRRLDRIKMPHANERRSKIMAETFANVISADWITFRLDRFMDRQRRFGEWGTKERKTSFLSRSHQFASAAKWPTDIWTRDRFDSWDPYEMFCKQSFHVSWSNGRGMDRHRRAFRTISGPQMGTSINQLTICGLKKELTVCHPMHILCGNEIAWKQWYVSWLDLTVKLVWDYGTTLP